MYQELIKSFQENPRDVHTVPHNRQPKWFFVSAGNGSLFVEPARNHEPRCSVRRRKLMEKETSVMLELYHRRQCGEQVSAEASAATVSQVYWYGVFADMNW